MHYIEYYLKKGNEKKHLIFHKEALNVNDN